MLKRIDTTDVQIGMFVAEFGGSWFDHPFWRAGILIETQAQLDRIAKANIPHLMIDEARGLAFSSPSQNPGPPPKPRPKPHSKPQSKSGRKRPRQNDARQLSTRQQAFATLLQSKKAVSRTFEDLQLGWAVDAKPLSNAADDILSEIERDARALFSVTRLKKKDDYTYLHSIAVCGLMIAVAQQMGFDKDQSRELGIAGLLHDVGKIGTPDDILKKPGDLTADEREVIRNHPQQGHAMLGEINGIGPIALDVCLHHHEKMDGSGYPFGLAGEEISVFTRIAAVCDVFDALTSFRSYKKSMPDEEALTKMWSWEGHFDRDILAQLMLAIHAFPAGLLLRLSDDTLAVTQPREPGDSSVRVTQIYSTKDNCQIEPKTTRIGRGKGSLQVVSVEDPLDWGISDFEALSRSQILAA